MYVYIFLYTCIYKSISLYMHIIIHSFCKNSSILKYKTVKLQYEVMLRNWRLSRYFYGTPVWFKVPQEIIQMKASGSQTLPYLMMFLSKFYFDLKMLYLQRLSVHLNNPLSCIKLLVSVLNLALDNKRSKVFRCFWAKIMWPALIKFFRRSDCTSS